MADVPPRPPPHAPKSSNLPNGNYDIFIIPPHSAGSGFLYLPSLKPNLNSFIAGFLTALFAVGVYNVMMPALSQTIASLNSGIGLLLALVAVAAAFSVGRTTSEATAGTESASGQSHHHRPPFNEGPQDPQQSAPPPQPPPRPQPQHTPNPGAGASASSTWEKAREETRRREAERKKAEEAKAAADAAAKKKEEAAKTARAQAEREKWEQARAREKDAREREARERIAKERAAREAAAKGAAPATPNRYEKPTARTATDSDFVSQYNKKAYGSCASSVSGASESSYASASTARTTPPPSNRGPYKTADPNKIVIDAVYLFASGFARPMSMLLKDQGGVTDGLILRITTEGLFIDDDVRGVPQREWDVKAWGIKLVETGRLNDVHVFRATLRDVDEKKYIFVLPAEQSWKVDIGLERLRKGSQVRSMGMNMIKEPEMKKILSTLGGTGWA